MTRSEKIRLTRKKHRAYYTRRALRIIRKVQPKNLLEASEALGMTLIHAGTGAFRSTYRIYGSSLLIKFPIDREGKNHTRMEVKKIRALQKFPMWHKHLPPIHYFNGRDGVMVTKFYPKGKHPEYARNMLIGELTKWFCGVSLGDIGPDNIRSDGDDNLILLDLGY